MGLPPYVTDQGLTEFLEDLGCSIDSATVILDKATGQSKRFGFARFASVEHARSFVEPNHLNCLWRDKPGTPDMGFNGSKLKIDYSQTDKLSRETDSRGNPRAPRSEQDAVALLPANDGIRDIGTSPSPMLLMRGLDSLTTKVEIGEALTKMFEAVRKSEPSTSKNNAPPDSTIKRVLLIKDRSSTASLCFAFAEFTSAQAAAEGFRHMMNSKLYPRGFRISDGPIAVTFCHPEAFRVAYAPSQYSYRDDETQRDMQYWDTSAFASIYEMTGLKLLREKRAAMSEQDRQNAEREQDVDAFFADLDKETAEAEKAQAEPVKAAALTAGFVIDLKQGEKRKASEPIVAKKNSVFITHWNSKKLDDVANPDADDVKPVVSDEFPHGDPAKFQCLLCSRQFKDLTQLKKHNDGSDLHKTNLKDEEKMRVAVTKKAALAPTDNAYRDRASERRIALNQPERPTLEPPRKKWKTDTVKPAPTVKPNQQGITEDNRGHKLLAAAGWTKGESLGLGGSTGIVAPIEAVSYATGAGIGAAKGTAISQMADPQLERAAHGREKARARYQG